MGEERVHLRLRLGPGPGQTIQAPAHLPAKSSSAATPLPPPAYPAGPLSAVPMARQRSVPAPATAPAAARWPGRPLVALVEAVPCGADELALTLMNLAGAMGQRAAVISLEQQNRLGLRLGHPANSSAPGWGDHAEGQVRTAGSHWLVPAPDREEWLEPERLTAFLNWIAGEVDATVVDLGCRWEPRIFRPVLQLATHIWLLSRAGKGTALEMRLEQAEFSGWTDMRRLRPVILGETGSTGAMAWGTYTVVLPDVSGQPAHSFILRELGGSVR